MEILDVTKTYLSIFNNQIEIDKELPKWKIALPNKDKAKGGIKKSDSEDYDDFLDLNIAKNDPFTLNEFLNLNSKDFNIYVGKKIVDNTNKLFNPGNYAFGITETKANSSEKYPKFIKQIVKLFRKFEDEKEEKEVYEINVFEFFDKVKLHLKESRKTYIQRIEPYMIALKDANKMGQKALIDKLTAEIYVHKYESILYAADFYYKITEKQLVNFVKKSEKGLQLCYIKNFVRPIPRDVIKKKEEADNLLVFDNYCVLYYDKDTKSYQQTKEEAELERRKKTDPILFGMIHGTKNLYYICDWIDEYCDLTLDEFLRVSGIDKEHIKIDEKINL